jgi:hypothetical protein
VTELEAKRLKLQSRLEQKLKEQREQDARAGHPLHASDILVRSKWDRRCERRLHGRFF